jgi:spore germination protein PD
MKMEVINKQLHIGKIDIMGVASSSMVLVGDTEVVTLSSISDTPPESVLVGPIVPLASME